MSMIPRPGGGRRLQSEVIGTLLFTGVVVVLIALVGMFVLSGVDTSSEPAADLEVTANSTAVTLTHGGGDDLAAADVRVSFGRDASGSDGLENWTEVAGDGDGQFEGGEVRTTGHGAGDVISVTVVHEPSGTLLGRENLDVP